MAFATDPNGAVYNLERNGTNVATGNAQSVIFSDVTGDATDSLAGNVQLDEGEEAEFTLTVTRTNAGGGSDDGIFRTLLKAIGWNTTDSTTVFNVYDFDLEDYKTSTVNLN